MATTAHSTYYSAVGQPIRGGYGQAVSGPDVLNNVWTPTRDGSGTILPSSRANLPLGEWCKIAGTRLSYLFDKLMVIGINPNFYDFGSDKLLGSMNIYSGLAHDPVTSTTYHPRIGGHSGGSLNGIWKIDLNKLGGPEMWTIIDPPSNPNSVTFPWSAEYKSGSVSLTYSMYTPQVTNPTTGTLDFPSGVEDRDILPDSKPTSVHLWGGLWYDTIRNTINTGRLKKWTFNPATGLWSFVYWKVGGVNYGADSTLTGQRIYHHVATDRLVGVFGPNQTGWARASGGGRDITQLAYPPMPWLSDFAMSTSWLGDDDILTLNNLNNYNGYPEAWGIYNIPANTWTSGAVGGVKKDYDYNNEMMVNCVIPEWNKSLRRGTYSDLLGQWWMFDIATKSNEAYTPLGLVPPMINGNNLVGNKCFYDKLHKCVYYYSMNDTTDFIYVMRTGIVP